MALKGAINGNPADKGTVAMPLFNFHYAKHGGLHFLRLGRFQLVFVLCSPERTTAYFNRRLAQ